MFLTDIEEVIERVPEANPLRLRAEIAREKQADSLTDKIKIVHDGGFFENLTTRKVEDFRITMGFTFKNFVAINYLWPSLTSLSIMAAEKLGIEIDSPEMRAMLTSAVLGEIPNDLPFHDNAHYRKVTMSAIRQVAVHNEIYRDTEWELGQRDIALMITAAHIHDFMHDGKEDGSVPMRLEKQSFELAKPFLIEAGVDDEFLADLEVMVLSTYVRPFGSPEAPTNQMKAAYKHYFENDGQGEPPELCPELQRLHGNKRLCLLSALFQESDLMPSLIFGYDAAKREHEAFCKEEGLTPSPQGQINFMNSVADSFITKAGQENRELLDLTMQAFEKDVEDGIVDYTKGRLGNIVAFNRARLNQFVARNLPWPKAKP